MFARLLIASVMFCIALVASAAQAEPSWGNRVILPPDERAKIKSQPIHQRPYRPLHVYGNAVRRRHYRGTAAPSVKDFGQGLRAFGSR